MKVTNYHTEFLAITKGKRLYTEMHVSDRKPFLVEITKVGAIALFRAAESTKLPFYMDDDCVNGFGYPVVVMGIGIPGQPHPPGSPFRDAVKEVMNKYADLVVYNQDDYGTPQIFSPMGPTDVEMCNDIVEIFHRNGYEDVEYDGYGVNFIDYD